MFLQKKAQEIENLLKQAAELSATAAKKDEEVVEEKKVAPVEEYDASFVGDNALQTLIYHLKARNPDGSAACLVSDAIEKALSQITGKNDDPASLLIGAAWKALGKTAAAEGTDVPETKLQELANMALANQEVREAHPEIQPNQLVEQMKDQLKAEQKAEKKEEEAAEAPVEEPAPAAEEATEDPLAKAMGDEGGKDNETEGADFMAGEETDPLTPETTGKSPIASLDSILTKVANDLMEQDTATGEEVPGQEGLTQDEKDWIDADLVYGDKDDGLIVGTFTEHFGEGKEQLVRDYLAQKKNASADAANAQSLNGKIADMDNFIAAANDYEAPAPAEDAILDAAKTASDASAFLQKIATFDKKAFSLDEDSGSPQPKGKDLFNGDKVTYTQQGKTPNQFPGQKVFSTREGGNPKVESVYDVKGKADVDVYNNQAGRKAVKSINDPKEGTIAFMQPFKTEEVDITLGGGFNYNGIVTGELQKTKETNEKLAGAGHKTQDYLDKIDELADKKDVTGKVASFTFSGLAKTAEEVNTAATGTVGSDNFEATGCGDQQKAKSLQPAELVAAQKKIQEKEDQIEAAH